TGGGACRGWGGGAARASLLGDVSNAGRGWLPGLVGGAAAPRPPLRVSSGAMNTASFLCRLLLAVAALTSGGLAPARAADPPLHEAELVFPLHPQHIHGTGVAECPNGVLLVSLYRGSAERSADDAAAYGPAQKAGSG